jgi:hypothetical protein
VAALVEILARGEPAALARMRDVVGARRARIALDREAVDVAFDRSGALVVGAPGALGPVDGEGRTDRATVLDVLDGYLEVVDAILTGRLDAVGEVEAVARIFAAIEILLDASSRTPGLQGLARGYRASGPGPGEAAGRRRRPGDDAEREHRLLQRLDLL